MAGTKWTRRDFLKGLGIGAASLGVPACWSVSKAVAGESKRRPNILLIMSDDMGFSDLGCYGGEAETPNLDALAAGGLRFTQFYNTARCCPTRASLMTGLYQHQAGMGHMTYDAGIRNYEGDLNRRCVTIAEALKPAGYRTYMAGKWHVTRHTRPEGPKHNWPRQRGFDRFYGTITGAGSFYDPTTLCRGNTYITPENDPEYQPETFYYTDAISDNAVRYLRDHEAQTSDQPFFIYVAYTAAHWPMHALEKDIAKYKGKFDKGYAHYRQERLKRLRKMGLIDEDWSLSEQPGQWDKVKNPAWEARCMEVYAAMIDNMDRGIGRIVAELKRQGTLDNTLILFLQDNGGCAEGMGRRKPRNPYPEYEPMGPDTLQKKIWPPMRTRDGRAVRVGPEVMPGPADTYIAYGRNWANVSNTPFRLYKHWVHEGGISTPLICHWPGHIKSPGSLCKTPGHLIDIMATCVDVAGAAYPTNRDGQAIQPMEGSSLRPLFEGEALAERALFWEHEGNRAVRQGKWKLVSKHPGGWELYDMEMDRTELNNLAEKHPEKVATMKALYDAWAKRCGVHAWPLKS